jgi:hypothetical protein
VPETMVSVVVPRPERDDSSPVIDVRLRGRFVVTGGGRSIHSRPRPNARLLCQLVLVSAGRRISRECAREALFPSLSHEAAARSLYTFGGRLAATACATSNSGEACSWDLKQTVRPEQH